MKLNNYIILITILCILLYHFYIQNKLEKIFFDTYLGYNNTKRPLNNCNYEIYNGLCCMGLPSGHAETSTIIFSLLYFQKYINLNICLLSILCISIQRILTKMHTITQVIIGILFGFIYSQIYIHNNLSIYSFLIVIIIGLVFNVLTVFKIDENLKHQFSKWVDNDMILSIKKKLNTPYYFKVLSLYATVVKK